MFAINEGLLLSLLQLLTRKSKITAYFSFCECVLIGDTASEMQAGKLRTGGDQTTH